MEHLSSGFQVFGIRFLQDSKSAGSGFFRILRQYVLQENLRFFNVPQHFEGSTLVVKHLISDCSPVYTHKHISPPIILSSNSKTSRGGHLMHLHKTIVPSVVGDEAPS